MQATAVKKRKIKISTGDAIFTAIVYIFLIGSFLVVAYPMYFTILASLSDPLETARGNVVLLPKGFTLEAYQEVFKEKQVWVGYLNTIYYTLFGTIINLICTIPCAYALSKKHLPLRRLSTWFFMLTMYFNGGIIPTYLVIKNLNLIDTRTVLLVSSAVQIYFLVIARNYYDTSIPEEIYEAAYIDGTSELGAFFRIALPLSTPIIALMILYYAVMHWNTYINAFMYITSESKYPLQLVLRRILLMSQNMGQVAGNLDDDMMVLYMRKALMAESMKYALIFIASFPVMLAYSFVQKYFIQGLTAGAVKG